VPLGEGETRFDCVLSLLSSFNYKGGFIIQGARQKDDVQAAKDYFQFSHAMLNKYFTKQNALVI
jgi:L-ribulose-5-phosphate 3-epimerase UlaE